MSRDVPAVSHGVALIVSSEAERAFAAVLRALAAEPAPDPVALARLVPDMKRAKYDHYLGHDLLARCYASEMIDAELVPAIAHDLLGWMAREQEQAK